MATTPFPRTATAGVLLAVLLTACTGYKGAGTGATLDDDDDGVVVADGDGGGDCGDTAPVLTGGPWCTYPGLDAPEQNLDPVPVIRIGVDVHDDDGDLHYRATRIWADQEPWGQVDTDTARLKERSLSRYSDDACQVPEGVDVGDKIYLQPDSWDYGVDYDFGIAVSDAQGNWSEVAVVTCPTPLEDGTEP